LSRVSVEEAIVYFILDWLLCIFTKEYIHYRLCNSEYNFLSPKIHYRLHNSNYIMLFKITF